MWLTIFDPLCTVSSVLFCCIAVKLIDDTLDKDYDSKVEYHNFATTLGPGAMVYAILSLALAASINASISIPLFLASYSIGMFHDVKQLFPSGLSGLQESVGIFFIGVLLWGWQSMLFSILFIFSIQLFDDYIDIHRDQLAGYRNFAHCMGKVECLLLAILTLLLSWQVYERLFPFVFFSTLLFYSAIWYYQRRSSSCCH